MHSQTTHCPTKTHLATTLGATIWLLLADDSVEWYEVQAKGMGLVQGWHKYGQRKYHNSFTISVFIYKV